MQPWIEVGVCERIWAVALEACEDLGGCDWEWQAANGAMRKERCWGDLVGRNLTDRAKLGVKQSILFEDDGGPLAYTARQLQQLVSRFRLDASDDIVVEYDDFEEATPAQGRRTDDWQQNRQSEKAGREYSRAS
jgi:hypothetical protein